jgi:hypothetical protein
MRYVPLFVLAYTPGVDVLDSAMLLPESNRLTIYVTRCAESIAASEFFLPEVTNLRSQQDATYVTSFSIDIPALVLKSALE